MVARHEDLVGVRYLCGSRDIRDVGTYRVNQHVSSLPKPIQAGRCPRGYVVARTLFHGFRSY